MKITDSDVAKRDKLIWIARTSIILPNFSWKVNSSSSTPKLRVTLGQFLKQKYKLEK